MAGARRDMTVFQPAPLADFILWVVKHHKPPSTLVICGSRQSFLQQLYSSVLQSSHPLDAAFDAADSTADADAPPEQIDAAHHPLVSRTLHILAASQTIQLAFCPSVSSLHAYLATLPQATIQKHETNTASPDICDAKQGTPILAVVNVLALHREGAAYSGQALSKAFAASVEAASRTGASLVIIDCTNLGSGCNLEHTNAENAEMAEDDADEPAFNANQPVIDHSATEAHTTDPWEDQIPILNPSTKAFGVSGERRWMDKTTTVREVVARWCQFRRLDET